MKKTVQYTILPELRLIIEYLSGEVTYTDLVEHRGLMSVDPGYNREFRIIFDARDALLKFTEKEVVKFVEFSQTATEMLARRKAAILTKTPHQTMITTIYTMNMKDLPFMVEIFSTVEAAMRWVGIDPVKKDEIDTAIEKMRENAGLIVKKHFE